MKNNILAAFVSAVLLVFAPALTLAQSEPPLRRSSGSDVKIVSIRPSTLVPLNEGEKLTISAEVDYVLAAANGSLSVVVQSEEGRSLLISCTNPPISNGNGRVTVTADILVKNTKTVQFIVALYHDEGRGTSITASRMYMVGNN